MRRGKQEATCGAGNQRTLVARWLGGLTPPDALGFERDSHDFLRGHSGNFGFRGAAISKAQKRSFNEKV